MKVYPQFDCQDLRDNMMLYMKTDVLQLAVVFERFRFVCQSNYELDPAHCVSAPQLSWESMLKPSDRELDLVSDPEIFRMVDRGIRGGVAVITHRHARANNVILGRLFNPDLPTSYIIYLDANNLYGWAMSQPLPCSDFELLTEADVAGVDWANQTDDQAEGYFVEVDLDYPAEMLETHKDYPIAPERLQVSNLMLSAKQIQLRRAYNLPRKSRVEKLIPNIMAKKHYLVHYLTLKFALL